jgi:hypothetical protein
MQLKEPLLKPQLDNRMRRELVVARHREDLAWLESMEMPAIVYDKSPRFRALDAVPLENVGREADTYLQHILRRWDDLADVTFFCQGNPHDHSPDFAHLAGDCERAHFCELATKEVVDDHKGWPSHPGLPLREAWERLWPGRPVPESFRFRAGAMFAVHKDAIRSRPKDFYEQMLRIAREPQGPWVLERLWSYVWQ